jgi:hypothetical protein
MFIPPGITSSCTRNPTQEWDCAGNNQLIDGGIHSRKGIPPGITSFLTLIQVSKIKMRRKSSERLQFQDQQLQILYCRSLPALLFARLGNRVNRSHMAIYCMCLPKSQWGGQESKPYRNNNYLIVYGSMEVRHRNDGLIVDG